jgi:hypothetical protein
MRRHHGLPRPVAMLGFATLVTLAVLQPGAAASRGTTLSTAQRVATVGTITTKDFRVAVVALRLSGETPPTAEVRVGYARRVSGRWRELGEKRLDETYFWNSVTGPRAVCRLEIETIAPGRRSFRPAVTVRLLLSPSLGCGNTYRIPLVSR